MPPLPELPQVELEVLSVTEAEPSGFLTLRHNQLVVVDHGKRSAPFPYDTVDRRALDAAVMVAHTLGADGSVHVYLRTAVRPPIGLRSDPPTSTVLWEVPAGLIEPGEEPRAGACRELEEELGFVVAADAMLPLGPPSYPAPGFIAEIHYFFHCRVDPKTIQPPGGDGSALEEAAVIALVPLTEALAACRDGTICDEKTELALRRLADVPS